MIDRAAAGLVMVALAACVTACDDPSITVRAFRAATLESVAVQPCDAGCGATTVFDGTGTALERTVGFYVQPSSELVTLQWTTSDATATRCDAFTLAYGGSPLSFDLHLSSTTPAVIDGCAAPTCSTPVPCLPFAADGGGTDAGGTDAGGMDGGSQTDGGLSDGGGSDGGSMDSGACTQGPPVTWIDESVATDQGFVGAWMASNGDIWAVASLRDAGSVWHYTPNPGGWIRVPALDSTVTYSSVSGTGPSDIWIAGTSNPATNPSYPIVLRGDGGSWTDAGPDATLPSVTNGVFSALWAASPSDVWVAGAQHAGNPSMFHWNGSQWLDESATLTVTEPLLAMAGTSASDVWAVGGMTNGEAEHRVGTAWLGAGSFQNQSLLSVSTRGGLAWAGAATPTTEATDVFDWNGSAWFPDTRVTAAFQSNDASSIWASGPADVWVGLYASIGHFDGTSWQTYVPSATCNNLFGVFAITGTCSDLWFLGSYGQICHMKR